MKQPRLSPRNLLFAFTAAAAFLSSAARSEVETPSQAGRAAAELTDAAGPSVLEDFNRGWRFHLGTVTGAEAPEFDDSRWSEVDLPHDWSVMFPRDKETPEGASVGYFRGGTGWYRKAFTLPAPGAGRAVEVIFDGVQQECEVWINGHYLGLQAHGYIGFVHTLTPHLRKPGERNVLTVRAVNPERNSRWYAGSGIYRNVQLRLRNAIHIPTWGLQLDTYWLNQGRAQVQVRTEVRNETDRRQTVSLSLRLRGPDGGSADHDLGVVELQPGSLERVSQQVTVEDAKLWTPDTPHLYAAEVRLVSGGQPVEAVEQTFGIRQVSVSAEKGFLLNGQPVKMKGACLHHDHGLIGAAAYPAAERRKVEMMKRNGYNAIRTSHNPPSTAFLEACDALGMLVIDEFVDMWEMPKRVNGYNRYFAQHWEKDLRAMIRRDFNHPSVVMWSIGNEIQERARPAGVEIARAMIACVRKLDTRPVTNALNSFWDNPEWEGQWDRSAAGFAPLDVAGYNYLWGEYESDHAKHPGRVMLGTESFPKEAYENWRLVEKHPYVIGDFVWTGMDHLGESGIGHATYTEPGEQTVTIPAWGLMPWPTFVNWSGDIDLIGNKKPQSHYRDVVWDRSVVELAVHRPIPEGVSEVVGLWGWPDEEQTWNWAGHEGRKLAVRVFSKAPRVRIELNGKAVGQQSIDKTQGIVAVFDVEYAPGELRAVALDEKDAVIGSRVLATTGRAAGVTLLPEAGPTPAHRSQLVYIPVEVQDTAGMCVNDAKVGLEASVRGPAELIGFGSADPTAEGMLNDTTTQSFRGRALLILRSTGKPGRVEVNVSSQGLAAGQATLDLR